MPAKKKDQEAATLSTFSRLEKRLREKAEPRLTEKLTIRLDKPTYEALESLAKEHNLSVSKLAREALNILAEEYRSERSEKQSIKQPSLLPQE
jgi:predicted HicB family RNase H-like nuclease